MKPKGTPKQQFLPRIDFGRENVILFVAGIIVLTIGYLLMLRGPWDNPLSRTVSPLILLLGYLVIFPAAILVRGRRKGSEGRQRSSPRDAAKDQPRQ